MFKKASKILLTVVGLVISFWAASSALAQWTEPTANPPLNNINQPVKQWDIWASDFGVDPDDDGNIDVYVPDASNAEIQIKSGTSPYWAIYQDDPTNQLRVWSSASDNLLSLTQDGKIGVNTDTPLYELTVYNPSSDVIIGMHPQGNTVPGVVGRYQENSNTSSGNSYFTYIANGGYHDPGLGESQFYGRNQYVNVQALTLNNDHGFRFLFGDPTINGESVAMTEVMRVQSNGRVGINNSNPTQELDVTGDIVASGTVCDVNGCIGEGTDSGGGWIDEGATVRLITASDNVGIGTVTPNQKLDVDGEIEFGDDQNWPGRLANVDTINESIAARDDVLIGSYGGFILKADMNSNGTGATPALQVTDNMAELFRINENGYVGIGTSNPVFPLQVEAGGANANIKLGVNSGNAGQILSRTPGSGGNYQDLRLIGNDVIISTASADEGSGSIEALRVMNTSGNVGIGTVAPAQKIEVRDDSSGTARIRISDEAQNAELQLKYGAGANDHWAIRSENTDDSFRLWGAGGSGNDRITVTTAGNVGINTTGPSARLDVVGVSNIKAAEVTGSNYGSTPTMSITNNNSDSDTSKTTLLVQGANVDDLALTSIDGYAVFIEGGDATGLSQAETWGLWVEEGNSSGGVAHAANFIGDICLNSSCITSWPSGGGGGGENLAATLALGADASSFTSQTTIGGILLNAGGVSGKLTVSTIDPVYTIDGQQYATYVSGMTGVKEETTGNIYLEKVNDTLAQAVIDFDEEAIGSDLWLFAQASNLPENFDTLVPVLTPGFDGSVWYEKNAAANQLIIYARAHGESLSDTLEVSYRLTAPRFDYEEWSNYSTDGIEGLNIDTWKAAR